jgi:hypothetical protein
LEKDFKKSFSEISLLVEPRPFPSRPHTSMIIHSLHLTYTTREAWLRVGGSCLAVDARFGAANRPVPGRRYTLGCCERSRGTVRCPAPNPLHLCVDALIGAANRQWA